MSKKTNKSIKKEIAIAIITFIVIFIYNNYGTEIQAYASNYFSIDLLQNTIADETIEIETTVVSFDLDSIPEYTGEAYVFINNNKPFFSESDYTTDVFETYSELDSLGRCGVAYANICKELMPKSNEKRGEISSIHPSGWINKEYKDLIKDGGMLYNRCHLIGWQLAGENANAKNLITGTRYMNTIGMLPFENQVANYLAQKEFKKNHVLYRVTPVFEERNLVASGVQMEAYSVEDNGEGVCYNIYVYNVQPGIEINYLTGESNAIK